MFKCFRLLLLFFLLTSCAPVAPPVAYAPYYIVTAAPDASATPTPFQPLSPGISSPIPVFTATLTPVPFSATPAPSPTPEATQFATLPPPPTLENAAVISILLLGSDLRSGASFRTDTIVVALVRPNEGQVSLISIPRDLWVEIPGIGPQRINTAYQSGEIYGYPGGGPGLLKDTLLNNLGIQIDHTALVDFDGFRKIINTLGGVDVPIACPYTDWHLIAPDLNAEDENNWALYTAGPGVLHMDGDLTLWYARSRKKSNDFDRGRRQQEVLRSLYGQFLRTQSLPRLPQLYADLNASVRTDFGLDDILAFAPLTLNLTNADIRSYYIAGEMVTPWTTPGGAAVLLPNPEAIQAMLAQAISPSPLQTERQMLKVEIQNGSANDGWDALAAERLNYAGYATSLFHADHRQHNVTLLYDLTADQDALRAASLLAVLGLEPAALVKVPGDGTLSYVLLLGNDYQPCFIPQNLTS
ncbi:hypothetical protein GW781_08485 [bacterium]|nr:hypothetical protein [bacterium]NCT21176.1 hypothetical protein [bacterium]